MSPLSVHVGTVLFSTGFPTEPGGLKRCGPAGDGPLAACSPLAAMMLSSGPAWRAPSVPERPPRPWAVRRASATRGAACAQARSPSRALALGSAAAAAALARRQGPARRATQCRVGGARAGTPSMRVFGISDIHTDHKENWARLAELPVGPYLGDVLLVAGDVSHDMRTFSRTMHMLRERFALVFFVPGNHDVWVGDSDVEKFEDRGVSGTTTRLDSLGKHRWLLEECARLGVWTTPAHFPQEELVIVPLLSWYHEEFDTEPDVPDHAWSSAAARRQRRMAMLSDEIGCEWPAHLGTGAPRNYALAELLDAANDEGPEEDAAPLTASVAAEPVSFREAKAARERGASVISFSHFLPRPELLPEKRFLFFPQLAKAAGSLPLRTRVADLRPTLHLFGHTHFAWDQRLSCARYVQAARHSTVEFIRLLILWFRWQQQLQ